MTEGPGNANHGNYYPAEALAVSFRTFEGVRCFLNHPSFSEERDRPERDVLDECGWFANVRMGDYQGRAAILGELHFMTNAAGREAVAMVRDAIRYQRQYPDRVLVGFSINASGPSHDEMRSGKPFHIVDAIDQVTSVDLVTFPARGGRVLELRESQPWRRRLQMEMAIGWESAFEEALREGAPDQARDANGRWVSVGDTVSLRDDPGGHAKVTAFHQDSQDQGEYVVLDRPLGGKRQWPKDAVRVHECDEPDADDEMRRAA